MLGKKIEISPILKKEKTPLVAAVWLLVEEAVSFIKTMTLGLIQDLVHHKGYANAALLRAIEQHETAAQDPELRKLLHHIILANRFWVWLIIGLPFVVEEEAKLPETFEALKEQYRETHIREQEWLSQAQTFELERALESPFIPGQRCSVAQALMQVCLHSQGHRAQIATRLRSLGGTPPALDYILWLPDRLAPAWD